MRRTLAILAAAWLAGATALLGAAWAQSRGPRWYKGNTHCHTTRSDGDSPPEAVASWYREHGYDFLCLSDHNVLTRPGSYPFEPGERFLLIPGEEITDRVGKVPVHVNGIGLGEVVKPAGGRTVAEAASRDFAAAEAAGALAHLNHPNYGRAFGTDDLLAVEGMKFIEVWNGHPGARNTGDATQPSVEAQWDKLLAAGRRVMAVAVDDAHVYRKWGEKHSNPGRAWICVRAEGLSQGAILRAIAAGDFYASTGVALEDVRAEAGALTVAVAAEEPAPFTVRFIGRGGETLLESRDRVATYRARGDEKYVRARVDGEKGRRAWTQPLHLEGR